MARELKVFSLRGTVVLFDPDMQLPDCVHTFLWNTEEHEVDRYQSTLITPTIDAAPSTPSELLIHLSDYLAWKEKHLAGWLSAEKPYRIQSQRSSRGTDKENRERKQS